MRRETLAAQSTRVDLDGRLAAWMAWFEIEPMPTEFVLLVDQLEAAYRERTPKAA